MSEKNNVANSNAALFIENRNKVAPEVWFRQAGRYVAWNLEGTDIVASGVDPEELEANLAAARIETDQVVHSYCPGPGETFV